MRERLFRALLVSLCDDHFSAGSIVTVSPLDSN
jgi:hypothetical protein